jgi:hypothetical protein
LEFLCIVLLSHGGCRSRRARETRDGGKAEEEEEEAIYSKGEIGFPRGLPSV